MKKNEKEKLIEYKIILIGDTNSNKTKIFNKMMYNSTTIGVDFETNIITYKNKEYSVKLFDTSGQERFRVLQNHIFIWVMDSLLFLIYRMSKAWNL